MTWRIHHKNTTVSTNLDAHSGIPGDVFTADYQTAGRGRLDHTWQSAPGENLMLSAVLDVAGLTPDHVATLPLAIGLAVLDGIGSFLLKTALKLINCQNQLPGNEGLSPTEDEGLSPRTGLSLKWPNDVLFDGRKLSGILCERHGDAVVVGLGVNVNQAIFASDIEKRAISLVQILGTDPEILGTDPQELVVDPVKLSIEAVRDAVLEAMARVYGEWRTGGFKAIYPRIARRDFLKDRYLSVLRSDDDSEPVCGVCGGILPDGALDVAGARVYAGEAHVSSM